MSLAVRALSIAPILFTLAACTPATETQPAGTTSTSTGTGGAPASSTASIRVVHASADAPAVDVYAKGVAKPLISGLTYGDASQYLALDPGTYDLELRASPSTASDPVAYETGPLTLKAGDKFTAIAAGLLAGKNDSDKFRVLPLAENFGVAGSNSAVVRIVHAGADAPTVDIDLDNDNPAAPDVTGLDRFKDSGDWGIPITSGEPRQIGIAAGGKTVTAFTTPALPDGAQLFVIATGLLSKPARGTDGFDLLAIGPDGAIGFIKQNPVVSALHAGPDAPAVDVFAGDAELIDNISFGQIAGGLQVPPANYKLDFFAHTDGNVRPSGAPAASAETGDLKAGEHYLAAATGLLSATDPKQAFRLVAVADQFAAQPQDQGLLRIVHGCPDAPAVDVGVLNAEHKVAPVLVSDLTFGNASDAGGLAISPGTTPIGIAATGSPDPVASFHVGVTSTVRGFAIAAGSLGGNGQSFRLLVVDTATSPWSVAEVAPQPL